MRITKTMLSQLANVARSTQFGGSSTAGCGNGDFNRYMRLMDAGLVAWAPNATRVVITDAGRELLTKEGLRP